MKKSKTYINEDTYQTLKDSMKHSYDHCNQSNL